MLTNVASEDIRVPRRARVSASSRWLDEVVTGEVVE